jgi:hypothetical protein
MGLFTGARLLPDGGVRLRLGGRERAVLGTLPDLLRRLVADEVLDSPVARDLRSRLYPDAYDDPELEAEYRDLVGADLARERVAHLDTFARSIAGGRSTPTGWSVDLSPEEADAWLSATNDARLVLGVLLGLTDESQWEDVSTDDPQTALLLYLGWLQDQLTGAMSGALRESE